VLEVSLKAQQLGICDNGLTTFFFPGKEGYWRMWGRGARGQSGKNWVSWEGAGGKKTSTLADLHGLFPSSAAGLLWNSCEASC
jgi:hypothetical protein